MCHELRAAPAQPLSHKAWHQAGTPPGSPQLGGFSIPPIPDRCRCSQPALHPALHPPDPRRLIPVLPGLPGAFQDHHPAAGPWEPCAQPRSPGPEVSDTSFHSAPGFPEFIGPEQCGPRRAPSPGRSGPGRRAGRGFLPLSGEAPCSGTKGSSRALPRSPSAPHNAQ